MYILTLLFLGERHGTAAERVLAAQNPLFQQDRPNQMFSEAPGMPKPMPPPAPPRYFKFEYF
jgi:hypothetical protein